MRFTHQRQLILQTLKDNCSHPDADAIYQLLKAEHPELSLGTVYRNLNLLSDAGIIHRMTTPSVREHYDAFTEPHYHLFCELCHSISDLPLLYQETLNQQAAENTAHLIRGHEIIFHGVCVDCRKKSLTATEPNEGLYEQEETNYGIKRK